MTFRVTFARRKCTHTAINRMLQLFMFVILRQWSRLARMVYWKLILIVLYWIISRRQAPLRDDYSGSGRGTNLNCLLPFFCSLFFATSRVLTFRCPEHRWWRRMCGDLIFKCPRSTSSRNWKHETLYLFRRDKKKITLASDGFSRKSVSRKSRQLTGGLTCATVTKSAADQEEKVRSHPSLETSIDRFSNANKIRNVGRRNFISKPQQTQPEHKERRFARSFPNFQGIMFDYRLWLLLWPGRYLPKTSSK